MDLKWPLLLLALLVLLPVGYALLMRFLPDPETPVGLPVAHAARLRALPRFRELARQQVLLTQVQLVSVGLVLVGAVWLAARPMHTEIVDEPARPGDLVVCADLTPAARAGTVAALGQVRGLLPVLRTEPIRIGMQGFQASTAELLALTDDFDQADAIVQQVQKTLTSLGAKGSEGAATGDGLVTCAKAFDAPKAKRGRAVILVGSGSSAGSVLSMAEAAGIAHDRGVTVYAVPVGASGSGLGALKAAARLTGGEVVSGRDPIDTVWSKEAVRLDPPPMALRRDGPFLPTVIVLLGLGGLLLAGLRGLFR
jgi:Ca-activated chloride channel family protein